MTETAREVFERLLAENPQFVKAPKTGQARRCRGTGRRPTGTCSSSAQEKRRSIAPASRTSPVFGLRKPPLSSVEGFCGRQFDPASPFFAPIVASRLQGADAFRLSVPALRGAPPAQRPPSEGPDWRSRKTWRKTCACRPPPGWVVSTFPAYPSSPISDGSGQGLTRQIFGSLDRN